MRITANKQKMCQLVGMYEVIPGGKHIIFSKDYRGQGFTLRWGIDGDYATVRLEPDGDRAKLTVKKMDRAGHEVRTGTEEVPRGLLERLGMIGEEK